MVQRWIPSPVLHLSQEKTWYKPIQITTVHRPSAVLLVPGIALQAAIDPRMVVALDVVVRLVVLFEVSLALAGVVREQTKTWKLRMKHNAI
jgi:uncharacterized membrane protein